MPEKVVEVLSPPVVRVAAVAFAFSTKPPAPEKSASEPMVLLLPASTSLLLALTWNSELSERPVVEPALKNIEPAPVVPSPMMVVAE